MLDGVGKLNQHARSSSSAIPEIDTRIAQYEMAFRMQTSVPELTDLSKEPRARLRPVRPRRAQARHASPRNCLLARRLAERGVRFIQLYHRGWDQHNDLPRDLALQCQGRRPALGRAGQGPQAARPARRHAGHLGRRIRPHRLQPGHV